MTDSRPRINSAEVADFMLKLNRPVSAPELSTILSQHYPHLLVEKHDIYIRLRGFWESEQAECTMNNDVRPRTFHLKRISPTYFKFRGGRRTDVSTTAIVRDQVTMNEPWRKKTKRERDKAERRAKALYLSLMRVITERRQVAN